MEGSSHEDKLEDGGVEDIAPVSAGACNSGNSREVAEGKLVVMVQDGRWRVGCGQAVAIMYGLVYCACTLTLALHHRPQTI
jgi:hypothetical protein